jgi:tetratricopeptide (TPR) repeat protein
VIEAPSIDRADRSYYHYLKAEAFELERDHRARAHADSSRVAYEWLVNRRPADAFYRARLALMYAQLGRTADALREGRRAVELLPVERDALDGPILLEVLAEVHMRAGQHDESVALLERTLSVPGALSIPLLRIDPRWDPLRSHPRFQQLIARR